MEYYAVKNDNGWFICEEQDGFTYTNEAHDVITLFRTPYAAKWALKKRIVDQESLLSPPISPYHPEWQAAMKQLKTMRVVKVTLQFSEVGENEE